LQIGVKAALVVATATKEFARVIELADR